MSATGDLCPNCEQRRVKPGQLACGPCWGAVPAHLQRDVYRTWRTWRKDLADADAMNAYRVARDAALAAMP